MNQNLWMCHYIDNRHEGEILEDDDWRVTELGRNVGKA